MQGSIDFADCDVGDGADLAKMLCDGALTELTRGWVTEVPTSMEGLITMGQNIFKKLTGQDFPELSGLSGDDILEKLGTMALTRLAGGAAPTTQPGGTDMSLVQVTMAEDAIKLLASKLPRVLKETSVLVEQETGIPRKEVEAIGMQLFNALTGDNWKTNIKSALKSAFTKLFKLTTGMDFNEKWLESLDVGDAKACLTAIVKGYVVDILGISNDDIQNLFDLSTGSIGEDKIVVMVKIAARALGNKAVSMLTHGMLTEFPTSVEELPAIAQVLVKKMTGIDSTKLPDLVGGLIERVPTSLEAAQKMAEDIKVKHPDKFKEMTGLTDVPATVEDFETMVSEMARNSEVLARQLLCQFSGTPVCGDIQAAAKQVLSNIQKLFKLVSAAVPSPQLMKLAEQVTQIASPEKTSIALLPADTQSGASAGTKEVCFLGGMIDTVPRSLDEAKRMAEDIINKVGQAKFKKLTGLDAAPASMEEFTKMVSEISLKKVNIIVHLANELITEMTGGVITAFPFSPSKLKQAAQDALNHYTGIDFTLPKKFTLDWALDQIRKMVNSKLGFTIPMLPSFLDGLAIPKTLDEAKQKATEIIENQGQAEFKELTGLDEAPKTEGEFEKMVSDMAAKKAGFVKVGEALSKLTKKDKWIKWLKDFAFGGAAKVLGEP